MPPWCAACGGTIKRNPGPPAAAPLAAYKAAILVLRVDCETVSDTQTPPADNQDQDKTFSRGGARRAAGCGCDPARWASRISSRKPYFVLTNVYTSGIIILLKGVLIMAKTMKSYRFEQFTLDRLAALAKKLNLTETSALEYAVSVVYFEQVYDKEKKEG